MFTQQNIHKLIEADEKVVFTAEQEENLGKQLAGLGYPSILRSLAGAIYPPSTVYKGCLFFKEYKKSDDSSLLALSCALGDFEALEKRTQLNKAIIIDNEASDETKAAAKKILDVDLEQLGQLYWTPGNLHGARVLLDIGNYYLTENQEGYAAVAQDYFTRAAKNYYLAAELLSKPASEEIIKIIYKEKGLAGCGWNSVPAAKADLLKHISVDQQSAFEAEAKRIVEDYADLDPDFNKGLKA